MPPRRRRDGAAVQARTEEPSSARVRVPARQKAPRSFRRCRPSRGAIKEGSRLVRRVSRSSRPHHESNRRPGCPRRHEKGTRDIVQERAVRLFSSASALDLPRPRKWNTVRASRCVQVEARRPPMRQRIEGQRNRHRLVPASSGAKVPLAREDRTLVGCARVSFQVAEVGKRRRSSEKRDLPLATGRVDGSSALEVPQGPAGAKRCREPEPRWPSRGTGEVRSRALERALRGKGSCKTEGISDCSSSSRRSRDRAEGGLGGLHGYACRASVTTHVEEATGMSEVRTARIATGRKRPPR